MTTEIKYALLGLVALMMICITINNAAYYSNRCFISENYQIHTIKPN